MSATTQKVALVTGSANGIGKGIVRQLASDGFAVVINDLEINRDKAEGLARELREEGYVASVKVADVSDWDQVKEMIESLDRIDVMVANAAWTGSPMDFITDDHIDGWQKAFDVNLKGHLLCYKFAALKMIKQGWGGRIIGASSMVAHKPEPGRMSYIATKWAIRGLTQTTALELGKYGITVNCYAPGWSFHSVLTLLQTHAHHTQGVVKTEIAQQFMDVVPEVAEMADRFVKMSAVGRLGETEDVAALVSFLASDESSFITGQTLVIDGGIVYT
ncbi:hypothetical protein MD484_g8284, partial [Candolleomyces efflorescens]